MVRGGRQAHLRRHHSGAPGRQAHRRHQGADRRVRGDHAAEFPQPHDHPQIRPCVCANRLLIQDKVYDAFAAKLTEKVKAMKVGNGMEPGVVQGPLIDKAAVEKVEEHISDALSKGAKLLTGGKRHALGGTFFEPTVLANVNTSMKVTREETFGPVAPLFRFKDEKEAIKLANDTEFGLASYFYGRDVNRVWRVAEALEYGIVGINTGIISTEVAPFGGVKESGMGREGSKYGIEDYLVVKYLCMGGVDR